MKQIPDFKNIEMKFLRVYFSNNINIVTLMSFVVMGESRSRINQDVSTNCRVQIELLLIPTFYINNCGRVCVRPSVCNVVLFIAKM